MIVFWGGLRQNLNKHLTKLGQNLVDENPKLSKTPPEAAKRTPWDILLSFGFSSTGLCRSFVKALPKTSHKDKHSSDIEVTMHWPPDAEILSSTV